MNDPADQYRKPLDEFVSDLEKRQQEFTSAFAATNYGIHETRLGLPGQYPNHQAVPCSIYFYYVRVNSDGRLYITHHFYPGGDPDDDTNPANPADWPAIPRDEAGLKALFRDLALDARPTGNHKYPVLGRYFENITWRRKSYIAIFIDEVNWRLHKMADGKPCVVFITDPKDGKPGLENHTFFDAMDLDIEMPIFGSTQTDNRTAVVFVNHMKADETGNDLGRGMQQYFQFKMFFDVGFASGGNGMTVIFDPGGTNLGPPVPPP